MTLERLADLLSKAPLVASVQASEGSPVEDPATLLRLAQASVAQGVRVLRLQGVANIAAIKPATGVPVIGLIKRNYPGSDVYITPTLTEVDELVALGCEAIALDGTSRPRPNGETLEALIKRIHAAGALAMADCDSGESAAHALASGADVLGTTLAGYTDARPATDGPDLELVRRLVRTYPGRVIAEGRYYEPWQAGAALRIGAMGVVVGGALNDPVKQTSAFLRGCGVAHGPVAAVDIGGTWLRLAIHSGERIIHCERVALPADRQERLEWIRKGLALYQVDRVGVSTGGTVWENRVVEAKPIIPDHVGSDFSMLARHVVALNDGLATAWGHGCHPDFAGLNVATLALGTGVGCGYVRAGRLVVGPGGAYPRLNDLPAADGKTYEELLGGAALTREPSADQKAAAQAALRAAVETVRAIAMPDVVVVCGGVGLAHWLELPEGVVRSPYGEEAGLHGAAALARFPF